jgi:hypothetical protein
MRTLLVGEDNPLSIDPRHALYPFPPNCTGHRLCYRIMGLQGSEYIRLFDRVNLCEGKWSAPAARTMALKLRHDRRSDDSNPARFVLLGAKATSAFNLDFVPFYVESGIGERFIILPHPSGRNRAWQEPGAFERARKLLVDAGVLPAKESV